MKSERNWNKQWKHESEYEKAHKYSYSWNRIKEEIGKRLKNKRIKVCEFGAGGGEWLLWLKNKYDAKVCGVDKSKEGLRMAKMKVGGDLRYEDVRRTSFKNNQFDFVFSAGLLEHFPEKDVTDILKEEKRVLKKNGLLMNTVPNRSTLSLLWLVEKAFVGCDERIISKKEMHNAYMAIGLKDIKIIPVGLFAPRLRNKKWFSRLNLKFLENFKFSDNIVGFARK